MNDRITIIGPGRLGLSLAYALLQAEAVDEVTICGRRPDPPSHPLFSQDLASYVFGLEPPGHYTTAVILAVPDGTLREISEALAAQGEPPRECAAFHVSGALGTDPLEALHLRGYSVGTMHPLQTVANPVTGAERLPGSYFAISGEPAALAVARRLIRSLGSPVITVPLLRRPVYHAAAVLASNCLTGLVSAAVRVLSQTGVSEEEALQALLPLARGTLDNIAEMGAANALTGPVARGDVETVKLHLRALDGRERSLYAAMGREIVHLALEAGLDAELAEEIFEVLGREI